MAAASDSPSVHDAIETVRVIREGEVDARVSHSRIASQSVREHAHLQATFRGLPIGMMLIDDRGVRLHANERATDLLGKFVELSGRACDVAKQVLGQGSAAPIEIALPAENPAVHLRAHANVVEIAGEASIAVVILEDLSAEHAARTERERAEQVQELFLGAVSHDLRSPLQSILFAIEQLRSMVGPEDGRYADRVLRACHRMQHLLDDLLDLTQSRFGAGFPIRPEPTDLIAIARGVVDEIHGTRNKLASFELRVEGDASGRWDPRRLSQLVTNLVANACDHGVHGGVVRIEVDARPRDAVLFSVHNGGEPIAHDLLPSLFHPFHSAGARSRGAGFGLGLFIAHQIALAHGGDIAVESSKEKGTTMRVVLPREPPRASVQNARRS